MGKKMLVVLASVENIQWLKECMNHLGATLIHQRGQTG